MAMLLGVCGCVLGLLNCLLMGKYRDFWGEGTFDLIQILLP